MITYASKLFNNAMNIVTGNKSTFANVAPGAEVHVSTVNPVLGLIIAILAILIVLLAGKWL